MSPSHHSPRNRLVLDRPRRRSARLHFPFPLGHAGIRLLHFQLHRRSSDHQENVAGKSPPCFRAFLPLTAIAEHRLVLYILRRELPARRHPPRYRSALVSLPGPGVEFPVDAALGDRGDKSEDGGSGRLDVLFHHLRRGAGLRLLQCWVGGCVVGLEGYEGED